MAFTKVCPYCRKYSATHPLQHKCDVAVQQHIESSVGKFGCYQRWLLDKGADIVAQGFECKCRKSMKNYSALLQHQIDCPAANPISSSQVEVFHCAHCSKQFRLKSALDLHIQACRRRSNFLSMTTGVVNQSEDAAAPADSASAHLNNTNEAGLDGQELREDEESCSEWGEDERKEEYADWDKWGIFICRHCLEINPRNLLGYVGKTAATSHLAGKHSQLDCSQIESYVDLRQHFHLRKRSHLDEEGWLMQDKRPMCCQAADGVFPKTLKKDRLKATEEHYLRMQVHQQQKQKRKAERMLRAREEQALQEIDRRRREYMETIKRRRTEQDRQAAREDAEQAWMIRSKFLQAKRQDEALRIQYGQFRHRMRETLRHTKQRLNSVTTHGEVDRIVQEFLGNVQKSTNDFHVTADLDNGSDQNVSPCDVEEEQENLFSRQLELLATHEDSDGSLEASHGHSSDVARAICLRNSAMAGETGVRLEPNEAHDTSIGKIFNKFFASGLAPEMLPAKVLVSALGQEKSNYFKYITSTISKSSQQGSSLIRWDNATHLLNLKRMKGVGRALEVISECVVVRLEAERRKRLPRLPHQSLDCRRSPNRDGMFDAIIHAGYILAAKIESFNDGNHVFAEEIKYPLLGRDELPKFLQLKAALQKAKDELTAVQTKRNANWMQHSPRLPDGYTTGNSPNGLTVTETSCNESGNKTPASPLMSQSRENVTSCSSTHGSSDIDQHSAQTSTFSLEERVANCQRDLDNFNADILAKSNAKNTMDCLVRNFSRKFLNAEERDFIAKTMGRRVSAGKFPGVEAWRESDGPSTTIQNILAGDIDPGEQNQKTFSTEIAEMYPMKIFCVEPFMTKNKSFFYQGRGSDPIFSTEEFAQIVLESWFDAVYAEASDYIKQNTSSAGNSNNSTLNSHAGDGQPQKVEHNSSITSLGPLDFPCALLRRDVKTRNQRVVGAPTTANKLFAYIFEGARYGHDKSMSIFDQRGDDESQWTMHGDPSHKMTHVMIDPTGIDDHSLAIGNMNQERNNHADMSRKFSTWMQENDSGSDSGSEI